MTLNDFVSVKKYSRSIGKTVMVGFQHNVMPIEIFRAAYCGNKQ